MKASRFSLVIFLACVAGLIGLAWGSWFVFRASERNEVTNPRALYSDLPVGNWQSISPSAVRRLDLFGFAYANEWSIDRDQPQRLLVSAYRSPSLDTGARSWEESRGPRTWEVLAISKELANALQPDASNQSIKASWLWPLFCHFAPTTISFSVGIDMSMHLFWLEWWRPEGVPQDVAQWLLEHHALGTKDHMVWMTIYESGISVAEVVAEEAMAQCLERHRSMIASTKGAVTGYASVAWLGRICRKQYPDSRWWQDEPLIMAALKMQDDHDGSR